MQPLADRAADRLAGPRSGGVALLVFAAPVVLLQLLAVATLVVGRDTLYLRDVLTTHLPMKQAEALLLWHGALPVLDPFRGGGQPLLGNANGAPFYPDLLLYLVAPARWALNAHFWVHFLLAPWSFAWLARRLGCGREAAWVGGVVYALGGFFLSQMSYYDLVAGVALAPALVAAALAVRDAPARAGPVAAAGAVWALLLLAGDPALAALAAAAALLAWLLVTPAERGDTAGPQPWARGAGAMALAFALGTLVAAPALVEVLRALPTSVRGVRGFDEAARTVGSWDPRQALEQLLPLAFGRVDRVGAGSFWAFRLHTGALPFFLSLYPGALALALVAAAGRPGRRGGRFAGTVLLLGLLLALGRFDPLLAPLPALPGGGLLRFPVKAWLLVAMGLAALAAAGWERALLRHEAAAVRRLRVTLAVLGGLLLGLAAFASLGAAALASWMTQQLPPGAPAELVRGEPQRWAVLALAVAGVAALLLLLTTGSPPPWRRGAVLLAHAAAQLLLLAPATLARDAASRYETAPSFAAMLPPGTRLVHGSVGRLFGPPPRRPPPDGAGAWLARQGAAAGFPFVGVPRGWRYELALSPEGLDGFLTRLAADAMRALDDGARVRLLRAWGVEALILERPLASDTAGARLVARDEGPLAPVLLYRLDDPAPAVRRVAGARRAADPRAALAALLDPSFDPRREVVLPAESAAESPAAPGAAWVRVERDDPEELQATAADARAGWLVVARAWQPQWKATVDGRPATVLAADLHRLAVAVPAGTHAVALFPNRAPLRFAAVPAAAGLLGLLALALTARRRRSGAMPARELP
ncbi:MAG TPA: hypothetical protein VGV61_05785 [Thermoanaerobaculia bacterium]|jgi:hypothetical protein|nr:hypothetical protein [Thermoanaerobaculia bacterium]